MDIKSNILFRVAIYLRLSKEDGNFSSNGKFESNSINSQREIINENEILRFVSMHWKGKRLVSKLYMKHFLDTYYFWR